LGFERVQDMATVGSLYKAFGLQVAAARPELPDHVSAELEFVAVLLAKEAYARVQRWSAQAARSAQARRLFLREHLAPWFPRFAQRLAQHHRLDFYPAVAELVLGLLAVEGVPASVGGEGPDTAQAEEEVELMGACPANG
jgi:TorA maturation chaperone TorD